MITALVGGQYGSEGKGLIAGEIAKESNIHVRVGAANAGHTVYVDGEPFVLQQIPCAAYSNPEATLVVGPGAVISDEIMQREIEENRHWREDNGYPDLDLHVDFRAHVITDELIEREQQSDLAERIGSTSTVAKEGIGTATAARVMREAECVTAIDVEWLREFLDDTTGYLFQSWANDRSILLEGTQGTGLSLTTGQFPYCTSRNTTATGLAADAGVPGNAITRSILVCRTFPIRVAGNSGPFWHDSKEISWGDLGVDESNERTTVTKLVRRVATFSIEQVAQAAWLNGTTEIALTFADYLAPDIAGKSGPMKFDEVKDISGELGELVARIELATQRPVSMLGTGPATVVTLS